MAKMNEAEFKARIKSTAEDNVFLLYGDEKVQIRHYLEKLRERTVGKTPDEFCCRTITQEDELQTLYDAVLSAPSFLAEKIFVSVLDFDFTSLSDAEADELAALIASTPLTTVLVFACPTTSPSFAKGGNKKLLNAVDKSGVAVSFEQLSDTALEKQLVYWATKRDVKLNEYDAARIVSYCGRDLALLKNELDKLCAYKAHAEITRDDIEKFVTKNLEARIFDLASYIINGSPDKAISQINILISQKESPQGIISVLGGVYVDIYRVRAALESGESIDSLAKRLNYGKRSFVLQKAQRHSKKLSNSALRLSLNAIADTNAQLNSSSADGKILLEKLVARLTLIRTEEKH
ncbi:MULTISPECIES: DNA polymerase III subunit delta [unclassified Ruminococcus]|uniref:DNA polymerase III subunit delta n=1 Tax=unclassified Ruminococcus TaxID=2608920 RepID=UPI00210D26CF|nr:MULTISPECIES: DNA polymerase III subunit delta [unclassified Ruminococcus]MCQ4021604.1 DNA polymerase III subunit delta [Ruminococcus sp. zg-924]MCQ4114049.1 DNA polymerase III subunit delta [Ruminococcus sp. zg-921]